MKKKDDNINKSSKGGEKMAIAVKPISPTIVSDRKIIADIVKEVMRKPNQKALDNNKEALDFLKKLKG